MKQHFLRIDDVGKWQYQTSTMNTVLKKCATNQLPVVLGIIPIELEADTASFLNDLREKDAKVIELAMHGYTHDLIEFSEKCDFESQKGALLAGITKMESSFSETPKVFIPPEHILTGDTIRALNETGFSILSKQFKPSWDGRIYYALGRLLKMWFLLGKKVSFHKGTIARTSMKEVSISLELARNHKIKGLRELEKEYIQASKFTDVIGFLIHPQVLEDSENFRRFNDFLDMVIAKKWRFTTLSNFVGEC